MRVGYDVVGNIAILKFDRDASAAAKKKFALTYLKKNRSVTTVLEKVGKFSGRLRTLKTKYLAGEKTLEARYKENGCEFWFNVETCYFSPRLSEERKNIAAMVKNGENVLVMFGGVAPFAIVIAKHSKASKVVSVELGKDCTKYAQLNIKRNRLGNVEAIQGDVKRVLPKLHEKFDRIAMTRPNLADSFLDCALKVSKKGTVIHYYGFYEQDKLVEMREMIEDEAKKARKRIKIVRIVKAGDIGVRQWRYRADIVLLG